jgi:hypothetical protein
MLEFLEFCRETRATIGGNEVCSGTTSSYYCYLLVIYSWHTGHTCPLLIPCLLCVFQASLWYIDPDRAYSGTSRASGDIFSAGIVLLELWAGKLMKHWVDEDDGDRDPRGWIFAEEMLRLEVSPDCQWPASMTSVVKSVAKRCCTYGNMRPYRPTDEINAKDASESLRKAWRLS